MVLGGTPTFTPTVTSLASPSPVVRTPTPTFVGPTPLAMLLAETYTPTPFYVNTPHPATESYRAGIRFYNQGNYADAAFQFEQAIIVEAGAADIYFMLGEAYRMQGDFRKAEDAYQRGIEVNSTFGPNYLGRARANLGINPEAEVLNDLSEAIRLDANQFEAFIERGNYYLSISEFKDALDDFEMARGLAPDSPLPYLGLAKGNLALENPAEALAAAQRANQLDATILDVYLALGQAYVANDQLVDAIGALQTYIIYNADDEAALTTLASAYNAAGAYDKAIEAANRVIKLEPRSVQAYYERGMGYFNQQLWMNAFDDLDYAYKLSGKKSFDAGMKSGEAKYFLEEKGDAYIIVSGLEGLVKTDEQRVEFLYYRALSLDGIGESKVALKDWKALLELPAELLSDEMRAAAEARVFAVTSPTPSLTPSKTPRPSATPKVSATPAETETPTATATP
jgi:tetratricopeptide (TPR) repeat protein